MTTKTFGTTTDAASCSSNATEYRIEMPCAGSNASVSLSTQEPTYLDFGLSDITGMELVGGMLIITFADQQTLTIENFESAMAESSFQNVRLSDGEVINIQQLAQGLDTDDSVQFASLDAEASALNEMSPAAGDELEVVITKPTGESGSNAESFSIQGNRVYDANFAQSDIQSTELNNDGQLVITFNDGTTTIIENYSSFENAAAPQMTLSDGVVIAVDELLASFQNPVTDAGASEATSTASVQSPVVQTTVQTDGVVVQQSAPQGVSTRADQTAFLSPQELAEIEVAAGDPTGALENTGASFGSSVSNVGLGQLNDEGPIGPTALQFEGPDAPEDRIPLFATSAAVNPVPQLTANDAFGFEDTGINFGISAVPSTLDGSQYITLVVSGIPTGWTPVLTDTVTAAGQFNPGAGAWTYTAPAGQGIQNAPVFTPPLNSDADIPTVTATVTQYATSDNSVTGGVSDTFAVIVDAVADPTNLSATNVNGTEDNPVALNIQTSLQDNDGSEEITGITISGVPTGFTLNVGTDNGNGTWTVPLSGLPILQLTPTNGYSGTVTLTVTVNNEETQLSDTEFDFTNNTNTNSTNFDVTFTPVADAPSLVVNNPIVKEDGSIDLLIEATLQDTDGSESLVVTVSGIDNTWTINTGANNGTYNAATGIWTISMPAGQDYNGSLNFTPPADSDVDMNNIRVSAVATESANNTSKEVFAFVDIIADAVADAPTLDAGTDSSVLAGQSVAINITNATTDTDGSETLGDVTISGVPTGYSLSAGTDNGNGTWTVTQAQLNGLMLNTPANGTGTVTLTASVTATETIAVGSGQEVDTTDNTATTTDTVVITVSPDTNPPQVTFGANASGSAQVLEDGSIFVPITATLQGTAPQQLSVELTGVPSTWTIATGVNNGTYNSATGTWTITMPANTNYNGGLTFTPPADSDVDLTGLTVTATSTNTTTNQQLTNNTPGQVIVDAVADLPTIDAGANASVTSGSSVAINITNAATDTDNSETLGDVTISGVPTGYSLTAGTDNGNGTWTVSQADLANLRLNTPANGSGNVTLTASVTATESVTDVDFDNTNDTATNTDTVVISVNPPLTPPQVTFGANGSGSAQVYEDNSVFVPITATLTGNATNQQLSVELTGVPSTWAISTGTNNGTYNSATGTWTITMPANTNYNGGLTFTPPADSDIDLSGLTVTATSTNLLDNSTENTSTPGQVIVDAVADVPTLNVNNANGVEGSTVALNISTGLTDTDGSETLSDITISGVPTGFSLTAGTDNGNGTWTLTQAQLNGLGLVTPANFSGSVPLTASVTTTEGVTDTDFDFTNNVETVTKPFTVVISDTANPPTLTVAGTHQVLEDNSVYVPFSATLQGDNTEVLTVTVSNIPSTWTITTGANNGTYTPGTNGGLGTWTITMPAGQNYTGGLTFAPPADSDIDLSNLRVKAEAFAPQTNTRSSVTEIVQIDVDAVADMPTLDAGANQTVTAGNAVTLNITNALTDTDGSETLGDVTIAGVPNGYTLSAGTDNGNGTWTVTQAQLNGLQLNVPGSANAGNISLTVSTTSTEQISDNGEFILSNNTATNTDTVQITVNANSEPPTVQFGDGTSADGSAQVLEDGTVYVPIVGALQGTADQILTVMVSNIPSTWTIATGANNGTYNSTTGVWTITMPQNTNYNGGLTFTPPADSDIDLTGLVVKATSQLVGTNVTKDTIVDGSIIVDAVADMPTLTTQNATGDQGEMVDLIILNALTDTDGSESLGDLTISGVPTGFTLSAGTDNGNGTWTVTQAQLNGLKINIPNNATAGSYNLNVSVTSTERVTDTDFRTDNNTATNNQVLSVIVSTNDTPSIIIPTPPISLERDLGTPNVITGTITVDYGSDGPGEVCVPQNGIFTADGALANNALTHLGTPIVVTPSNGNTYTGVAGGVTVFTLVVQATGAYTFTQHETIDHASPNDPNEIANLNFQICARDNDGDMSVSILTVRVQDTGPVLNDDAVTMWSCDWAARGNVVTNSNQTGNGADTLSVEDPNEITNVDGQAFKDGGDAMVIKGTYGFLFMFKDGAYAYVSTQAAPKSNQVENFDYTMRDGDGDVDTATLTLSVIEATQTANPDADYGNQIGRSNYQTDEMNETNIYQTTKTDGAMVFGWTADDELAGNHGDDILLGWVGDDTLYGHDGNDVMQGEQGSNTLYGGADADIFVIHTDKANNNSLSDEIMDFSLTEGDVLSLGAVITGFGSSSDITDFVRISMSGNDAVVQVNTDGNGSDFYDVAVIKDHAGINTGNLDVQQLFNQGHIDVT
jgi:T1SS-143 domain-containing protein